MDITKQYQEQQVTRGKTGSRISSFISDYQIGTLLNLSGIKSRSEQRCHDEQKTIGRIFFACSEDIKNHPLLEALERLLTLVFDKIRSSGEFAEDIVSAMIDAIMGAAVRFT